MLPGLTPAHTRKSYHSASSPESTGARLSIERIITSPEDFLTSSETGLWLLPPSVAEKDVIQDITHASWLSERLEEQRSAVSHRLKFDRIARVLGRSGINSEGCVSGGLRGKQIPAVTVIEIAEFEMGNGTHTVPAEVPLLSMCGNGDCYNSRHHNLDFGGSRHDLERVELNPRWYETMEDGSIKTIWGDELPSVLYSLQYFIQFQRSNYPFVPHKDSKLTPTPISQVAFHPLTGCWESHMYEKNAAGVANIKNGYGVMYARQEPDQVDSNTGEIRRGYRRGSVLAHNLIWVATGHNLNAEMDRNHLCNYPRCCNPLHIEQITPDANRRHGHAARAIIRAHEQSQPEIRTAMLSKRELEELYVPLRQSYALLSSKMAA